MKKIIPIIAVAFFAMACQQKKFGAFTISGKVEHASPGKIQLQELPFAGDQPIILDSGTLKSNGEFVLRGMGKEEGLYRIVIDERSDILFINDGNDIKVELDLNNYRAYKIEGSPASESLHTFFEEYRAKDSSLYATFMLMDSLHAKNATDSMLEPLKNARDQQMTDMNKMLKDYITGSSSPAAVYYVLGMAQKMLKPEELLALTNNAAEKFKDHSGIARIKSMLTVQMQSAAKASPGNALLNTQAPEISLADTSGKVITLSSFKGKYVLVDFWASWCGPCRKENPNVVAAYAKFKDKNFTILGVSLDNEKANWLEAIKQDKLIWTHISDLKQWESVVVPAYKIDGIPFNVLVDPQGKIIATDLRGELLEKKLAEVLK